MPKCKLFLVSALFFRKNGSGIHSGCVAEVGEFKISTTSPDQMIYRLFNKEKGSENEKPPSVITSLENLTYADMCVSLYLHPLKSEWQKHYDTTTKFMECIEAISIILKAEQFSGEAAVTLLAKLSDLAKKENESLKNLQEKLSVFSHGL